MTIDERIQKLRKRKGLSQEQLADVLSVSRQAVSKWESGQSLPEIEKLIAMSVLFETTIDYILKGETPLMQVDKRQTARIGSQIVSAVAAMMLAIGILATVGQLSDGVNSMDIYSGLIIESVGIMLLLIGFFLAGSRVLSKPLFVANILMAGILPAMFVSEMFLRYYPRPMSPLAPLPILLFAAVYMLICIAAIYFAIIRRAAKQPT